jgi:hypothetical protein
MSNVVFVLGAGCSKECGAPLMADFLDVASYLHSTGEVRDKAPHFERVFKAIGKLQAVHSKSQLDLINIESVFNAFEIANTIEKLPGFETAEIPGVISSLKEVIVTTLEQTIKFPFRGSHIINAPQTYQQFTRLLQHILNDAAPTHTVSVITFNYDIAIDMALHMARIGPDYGFDSSTSSGTVPLLKLHGSLNWAARVDDNSVIPLPLKDYLTKYSIRGFRETGECSIPIGAQLQEYFSKHTDIKVKAEPVIVPPTWDKTEHHQILSQVWGRAAKELGEAEYIFIIGYSLTETDVFFRLLYALGTVSDTPLKKIEVFNPDNSAEIRNRFKSLMGSGAIARFDYIPFNFSDSISIIKAYFPGKP